MTFGKHPFYLFINGSALVRVVPSFLTEKPTKFQRVVAARLPHSLDGSFVEPAYYHPIK
jgi:hypothetical protein